jgi:hypothetical protein
MGAGVTDDLETQLILERLRSTLQLLRSEVAQLETSLKYYQELSSTRISALEKRSDDFESRLRALTDASTQFKVLAGLATGGGLLSALALLRALLGL